MRIKLISDNEALLDYKLMWEELYSKAANKTIFQSFSWNYTWWTKSNSGKLFVIAYHLHGKENNSPAAIFPFWIDDNGILRFIADIHSDYNSFIIETQEQYKIYNIIKNVVKYIKTFNHVDSIELKNINFNDPYINYFSFYFDYKQFTYRSNGYSSFSLRHCTEFSECFNYLPSKKRSELKRINKQYNNAKTSVHHSPQPFPKKEILNLAKTMKNSGIRDKEFINAELFDVITELYESGYLIVFKTIDSDDNVIAANLILKNKENEFIFWIDLFENKKNINIFSYISFIEMMCKNIDSDKITIDFGRGVYNYKVLNFFPQLYSQYTFFYAKRNFTFLKYILKKFLILSVKPFYKKHKKVINRILKR